MKYHVEDMEFPATLTGLDDAFREAAARAYDGDVVIEKREGDEVILMINVPQTERPERKGYVDVPKEHRKKFGA